MSSAFLEDGYTAKGYLKAVPQLYPEVRFTYRPILPEQRAAFVEAVRKAKDGPGAERRTAAILAKHLLTWDVTDSKGDTVSITGDRILRLRWALYDRLVAVVLYGTEGGDVDPSWTDAEKDAADAADDLGGIYRDAVNEADEKNSGKG